MNEELKILITAEIDKLKKQVNDAKKTIEKFTEGSEKGASKMDKAFKTAGDNLGKATKAGAKVAAAAIASVSTAIAGLATISVKSYAEYEQLTGGVEKLFGTSSKTIMKYAQDAYKNAGVNANTYMEQVTSFSASLISSLGGDTDAAAEYANKAINDMADNMNVFGSNIEDVQHAYQGFAKQNYTMLDNLKLGYGGTQKEMQRLIDDANKLKEAQGEVGDLTIDKYSDVIEAIHTVQTEMNITGTTAKEAEGTISGSINMTMAAWGNLMTGLADGNANIPLLVSNVISSATSVLENIIPIVKQVLQSIPAAISEISPEAGAAFQTVVDAIMAVLPILQDALQGAFDLVVDTIVFVNDHIGLISTIAGIITGIAVAIGLYNAVAAVKAAMDAAQVTTLGALIAAYIAQAAAMVVAIAPYLLIVAAIAAVIAIIVLCIKHWDQIKEAVANAWEFIKEKTVQAKEAIVNKFNEIKEGITNKVNTIKEKVTSVFTNIKDGMRNKINEAKSAVLNIFDGIKTGISNKITAAKEKVKSVIDAIRGFFNFEFKWPKVPLPHFGIKPSGWKVGDLLKGVIPKLSIKWNARGGIFDKPTLMGYGGTLQGLGEDGAEAIVPLEKNTQWLNKIADKLAARQGKTPIILQVDGKTFAQTTIDSINNLTRQTGKLDLKLV